MKHPWTKHYPEGVQWDKPLPAFPIYALLDESVRRFPDKGAIEFAGKTLSYAEFGILGDRAAAQLSHLGVGPGVHVGLFLPNSPHYPISFFAVLKAGGTVVNYSPLDAEKVLAHKIEDSETDFVITLDLASLYPQMARLLRSTRLKKLIVGSLDQFVAEPEAYNRELSRTAQRVPIGAAEDHIQFSALLQPCEQDFRPPPMGNPAEVVAVLQYTGGTTGEPKGAMLTHGNLAAFAGQFYEFLQGSRPALSLGVEKFLVVLPFFHIYAISVCLLLGVRLAAHLVLHLKFSADEVLADIESKQITVFPGVPTMYTGIIGHPAASKEVLRSLHFCASGGAPLPAEVRQRFLDLTGVHVCDGWGMTETGPGTLSPRNGSSNPNSCGVPAPNVLLKIIDLDGSGKEVPAGTAGELCLCGPNLMKGYWKNPRATAASMTDDGFFRTGDVAYMDDDGFFYIVDRTKEMLICGGYKVYPRLIEDAIYEHPAVAEVIVIGIADEYRGQSPKAFIKLKAGAAAPTLADLQAFLRTRLGKHEMIQAMEIRDDLPKTPVGKLSKRELIAQEAPSAKRAAQRG